MASLRLISPFFPMNMLSLIPVLSPCSVCTRAYPHSRRDTGTTLDSYLEEIQRTIEADFDRVERVIDRVQRQQPTESTSKQYKREWRNERSSGHEFYRESVVISRPSAARHEHRQSSPVASYVGVIAATVGVVLYAQKARAYRDIASHTVYKNPTRLTAIAPLLAIASNKFRQEWERAEAKRTQGQRKDTDYQMTDDEHGAIITDVQSSPSSRENVNGVNL